jgi:hypothetical protein
LSWQGFSTRGGPTVTSARWRAPRSHPDVAAKVDRFARFADDQYQDVTSPLAALSTRLREANGTFVGYDGEVAGGLMNAILELGEYIAPEDR